LTRGAAKGLHVAPGIRAKKNQLEQLVIGERGFPARKKAGAQALAVSRMQIELAGGLRRQWSALHGRSFQHR
jgi:hypothetical protein